MLTSFFMGLYKVIVVTSVTYTGKKLIDMAEKSSREEKTEDGKEKKD